MQKRIKKNLLLMLAALLTQSLQAYMFSAEVVSKQCKIVAPRVYFSAYEGTNISQDKLRHLIFDTFSELEVLLVAKLDNITNLSAKAQSYKLGFQLPTFSFNNINQIDDFSKKITKLLYDFSILYPSVTQRFHPKSFSLRLKNFDVVKLKNPSIPIKLSCFDSSINQSSYSVVYQIGLDSREARMFMHNAFSRKTEAVERKLSSFDLGYDSLSRNQKGFLLSFFVFIEHILLNEGHSSLPSFLLQSDWFEYRAVVHLQTELLQKYITQYVQDLRTKKIIDFRGQGYLLLPIKRGLFKKADYRLGDFLKYALNAIMPGYRENDPDKAVFDELRGRHIKALSSPSPRTKGKNHFLIFNYLPVNEDFAKRYYPISAVLERFNGTVTKILKSKEAWLQKDKDFKKAKKK